MSLLSTALDVSMANLLAQLALVCINCANSSAKRIYSMTTISTSVYRERMYRIHQFLRFGYEGSLAEQGAFHRGILGKVALV